MSITRMIVRLAGVGLALVISVPAPAAQDVGLISQLQGEVAYQSGSAATRASAFMKVREGDRFTVPDGAVVGIVYFDSGRQETWKGPSAFKAGVKQGDVASGKPEVAQVPGAAPAKLAQAAEVIQIARLGRAGGVTVRGTKSQRLSTGQAAEVAQAKKLYESWRSSAPADDIAPELYLYTVLENSMLYEDMKAVLKSMQERAPNSQEVSELAAWVNGR